MDGRYKMSTLVTHTLDRPALEQVTAHYIKFIYIKVIPKRIGR